MDIRDIRLTDLKPYNNNPRFNAKAVPAVKESILKFGFKVPLVIDKNNVIVCGHTRFYASNEIGLETVPCVIADDLSQKQIDAFRLVDNRTAEFADWDFEKLAEELSELSDFDLDAFGFDDLMAGFGDSFLQQEKEIIEDDFDEDVPEEPITKLGDFYKLGNHYLLCGDSTNEKDVKKLLQNTEMDLCITDPPYGVSLEERIDSDTNAWKNKNCQNSKIKGDELKDNEFFEFLEKFYVLMMYSLKNGGSFYIFTPQGENQFQFVNALSKLKVKIRQQLIWEKNQFVFSRCDYHYKHEPILYGWKDGNSHYFIEDRTKCSILTDGDLDIEKMKKEELIDFIKDLLDSLKFASKHHDLLLIENY